MLQTREQRRGQRSFAQIQTLLKDNPEKQKAYGRLAHKLPVLIKQAGLAQALTFAQAKSRNGSDAQAKSGDGSDRLLKHLAEHLAEERLVERRERLADFNDEVCRLTLPAYQAATREALDMLVWYKRFAQSVLNVEAGSEA